MKEHHLMQRSTLASLKSWRDILASARAVGDAELAREAERFVDEYAQQIRESQQPEAELPG
jgi:hypothetical protein